MIPLVMPFGKYKGEKIEDLPHSYMEWCLENLDLSPDVQKEMENQLAGRRGEGIAR